MSQPTPPNTEVEFTEATILSYEDGWTHWMEQRIRNLLTDGKHWICPENIKANKERIQPIPPPVQNEQSCSGKSFGKGCILWQNNRCTHPEQNMIT